MVECRVPGNLQGCDRGGAYQRIAGKGDVESNIKRALKSGATPAT